MSCNGAAADIAIEGWEPSPSHSGFLEVEEAARRNAADCLYACAAAVKDTLNLQVRWYQQPRAADPSAAEDSDQALVHDTLSRNRNSFAHLVERYERAVTGILWHFTRDPLVLQELVQDTFVEAYFSLRRFHKEAPFFPWLRVIATRVGYRSWRRVRRDRNRQAKLDAWRRTTPDRAAVQTPSDTAEYVFRVLESLDPKDRLVLTLQYFEGCAVNEIAQRTGWTLSAVKVRAFRARKRLQGLLSELERRP